MSHDAEISIAPLAPINSSAATVPLAGVENLQGGPLLGVRARQDEREPFEQ
jgi:hypothetical protein